ncbi:RNA-directed DNA polymerase from mobile element jockey-like [Plakobranchus ocellatus]|uniref:RNA-directed DNA polymerase from mobile element jockey-like n=1 Tax=Plakobranchus ocellatus TaxID=259542 RepID=A0AAV4BCL7_9GAST|nr:RNA-directed DNA polymerase from mobile element jockey-like [Plakobranchus ocellatus]
MPFDAFCPSLVKKGTLARRCCSTCGQYFPNIAAKNRHQAAHSAAEVVPAQEDQDEGGGGGLKISPKSVISYLNSPKTYPLCVKPTVIHCLISSKVTTVEAKSSLTIMLSRKIKIKFDVDKLKDPNILTTFQANIGRRFVPLLALDNDQDLTPADDLAETFNETLTEEASKLLGKPRVKKKKWMTDEILALCDIRRSLKKRKKESEGSKQHRETNLKVKRRIKEATEKWIEDQCEDIENSLKHNNSNKAHKIVKDLTGTKQTRATTIESKEGKCLTEEKEILERWTEYCSELYTHVATGKDPNVLNVPPSSNNARHSILRTEIIEAVSSLKPGKSAGIGNITGEMVQAGGEATTDMLFLICNKIWQTGMWPKPWTQSLVLTLPKKGNLKL